MMLHGSTFAPLRRALTHTLMILALAWTAGAEAQAQFGAPQGGAKPPQGGGQAPRIYPKLEFNSNDFIRAKVGRMRPSYFVGEPVAVPVTISNHTRFPLTITTNLAPRSHLKIVIRPENMPARAYYGPWEGGSFPTTDFDMLPLDELNEKILLWADNQQPEGLVFPTPGKYKVEMSLRIAVQGNQVVNTLKIDPVVITIVPTPANMAPLVQILRDHKLFDQLHRRVLAPSEVDTVRKLGKDFPGTPFTPYLYLSLASQLEYRNRLNPNPELTEELLYAYQIAARSDSAYRFPAYLNLIEFMDRQEMSEAIPSIFGEMVHNMPRSWRGKVGNVPAATKYLHMSGEIPPTQFWTLLQ
jgi:hypothetical protein